MRGNALLAGTLALLAGGCLSRGPAPRFYRPESAAIDAALAETPPSPEGLPLRLRTVRGASFLRERIVWRISSVEYGFYEDRRWSELPASYVGRALVTALRQAPDLLLTDDFRAPSLRVDVVAFEEVFQPAHAASVALVVSLQGRERERLLDRSFRAEVAIPTQEPADTARAMGRALDQVVAQVTEAVSQALTARSAPPAASAVGG